MNRPNLATGLVVVVILLLFTLAVSGQQTATRYDYNYANRAVVGAGMQALFICNGLFVSNRTMDQLYAAELKMDLMPLAPPEQIKIDRELKTVAIGEVGKSPAPVMRAVFREGLGCVLLGPEQTFASIDRLPILQMRPPTGDASKIMWPDGDLIAPKPLPANIDETALNKAADFAFERERIGHPSQITMSLLVVHK